MSFRPYTSINAPLIEYSRTNNTGVTFNKGTPSRINVSGDPDFIDVSIEAQAKSVFALAGENIANLESGSFVQNGKIENFTTSFSFGDTIYVSKTGGLTNIPPTIGVGGFVSGDFMIKLGIIAKNESNPALKDILVDIEQPWQM